MLRQQSSKAQQAKRELAEAAARDRREATLKRIATYTLERAPSQARRAAVLNVPKVAVASFVSPSLRDSANGAPCMFGLIGVCDGGQTTVWVHSDRLAHGNGWGAKGHDFHGAFGCGPCHSHYSSKPFDDEEQARVFQSAHDKSWRWLIETGRVRIGKPR